MSAAPSTPTTLPHLAGHRFAITGASGFLGRHVIDLLHRQGATIIALRRPDSRPLNDACVDEVLIDFHDEEACAGTLQDIRPTQLIHLAGYANTERSVASIARALAINVQVSVNLLLGAMDKAPECRVILAGSFEHASPWREPLQLGSSYGMSKAMVEVLSGSLNRLYDANVINMRIGMAYGENDPNTRRIIPSIIDAFLAGRPPQIHNGARLCDWIHAQDVAEALIRGALLPTASPDTIDVGWGKLHAISEVIEIIRQQIGTAIQAEIATQLTRKNEQARHADLAAAKEALGGWTPRIDLHEGMARTVAWHREQRELARRQAAAGRVV